LPPRPRGVADARPSHPAPSRRGDQLSPHGSRLGVGRQGREQPLPIVDDEDVPGRRGETRHGSRPPVRSRQQPHAKEDDVRSASVRAALSRLRWLAAVSQARSSGLSCRTRSASRSPAWSVDGDDGVGGVVRRSTVSSRRRNMAGPFDRWQRTTLEPFAGEASPAKTLGSYRTCKVGERSG
jgi:hypothetical protein